VLPEEQKLQSRWPEGFPVKKAEKEITILNRRGLDATLATLIVEAGNWFSSDIWVRKGCTEVNGKSLLGLRVLGAKRGSKLRIRVEGPDAQEALQQIGRLISWFGVGGDTVEPQDILDRPQVRAGGGDS
jgi:phosphotransferase system HPr (HPr) family protein